MDGSADSPDGQLRTVTAQLRVTPASLARLLGVAGSQTDFILSSTDGSTTVRVKLVVSSVPDGELTLGDNEVMLDWSRSTIARGTHRVSLTRKELQLLGALLEFAPAPVSRGLLIERMWPNSPEHFKEHDAALAVLVCSLRRRFVAIGLPDAISTVRSTGYSLSLPSCGWAPVLGADH